MEFKITSNNDNETQVIAEKLVIYLHQGSVLTLDGDLGAGKTIFTKGLAKGLGIKQVVNSPTFTIIKEYNGLYPLYHMDVYRLHDSLDDLGFDEYFYSDGITVVEWATIIEEYLPDEYLNIIIEKISDNKRTIIFKPHGDLYLQVCKEFFYNESFGY